MIGRTWGRRARLKIRRPIRCRPRVLFAIPVWTLGHDVASIAGFAGTVPLEADPDFLAVAIGVGFTAPGQGLLRRFRGRRRAWQMGLRGRFLRRFSVFVDFGNSFPAKVGLNGG